MGSALYLLLSTSKVTNNRRITSGSNKMPICTSQTSEPWCSPKSLCHWSKLGPGAAELSATQTDHPTSRQKFPQSIQRYGIQAVMHNPHHSAPLYPLVRCTESLGTPEIGLYTMTSSFTDFFSPSLSPCIDLFEAAAASAYCKLATLLSSRLLNLKLHLFH